MTATGAVRTVSGRLLLRGGRLTDPFSVGSQPGNGLGPWLLRRRSPHGRLQRERAGWFEAKRRDGQVVVMFPGETCRGYIGAFTSIADDVEIVPGGNHPLQWVSTFPFRAMWDLPGAHADGHPPPRVTS